MVGTQSLVEGGVGTQDRTHRRVTSKLKAKAEGLVSDSGRRVGRAARTSKHLFQPGGRDAPACPSLSPERAPAGRILAPGKNFQTGPSAKRCEASLASLDAAPMLCVVSLLGRWPSQEAGRIRDTVQVGAPQMGRARQGLMPGNGKWV